MVFGSTMCGDFLDVTKLVNSDVIELCFHFSVAKMLKKNEPVQATKVLTQNEPVQASLSTS